MPANSLELGKWWVQCDRCGFKYKNDQVKKEWNGLIVCEPCFETRHPQDFVRAVKDDQRVEFTRPEPADVFIDPGYDADVLAQPHQTKPSGTFDNGL